MSLRTKILSGFLILAAMLACAGVISIYELRSMGATANRLLNDNYKSISAAKTMLNALENSNSGVLLVLSGKRELGNEMIELADDQFQRAFTIAKNNITIQNEDTYVDRIATCYQSYMLLLTELAADITNAHNLDWYFNYLHQKLQASRVSVNELLELNDETMYLTAAGLYERANRAIMPGIVAITASLVFVLIFNYFINYYVVKPIKLLIKAVKTSSRAGSPVDVTIETNDELSDLGTAIKDLWFKR